MIGYTGGIAAAYGVSDFLGGHASRDLRPAQVLAGGRIVVLPVLAVVAPLSGHLSGPAVVWGALAGIPLYLGFMGIFAALSTGQMSVAAPVIALTAAGVPLVFGALLGDALSAWTWVGAGVAYLALVLLTWSSPEEPGQRWRVLLLSIGGGACLGLFTVLTSRTDPGTGVWPLLFAQLVTGVLAAITLLVRRPVSWPRVSAMQVVAGAAVFELCGDTLALLAARQNLALIGPALALQPAAVVLLARLIEHERISRLRLAGLAAALAALALLTTG